MTDQALKGLSVLKTAYLHRMSLVEQSVRQMTDCYASAQVEQSVRQMTDCYASAQVEQSVRQMTDCYASAQVELSVLHVPAGQCYNPYCLPQHEAQVVRPCHSGYLPHLPQRPAARRARYLWRAFSCRRVRQSSQRRLPGLAAAFQQSMHMPCSRMACRAAAILSRHSKQTAPPIGASAPQRAHFSCNFRLSVCTDGITQSPEMAWRAPCG
jgi:hypothetical protein